MLLHRRRKVSSIFAPRCRFTDHSVRRQDWLGESEYKKGTEEGLMGANGGRAAVIHPSRDTPSGRRYPRIIVDERLRSICPGAQSECRSCR